MLGDNLFEPDLHFVTLGLVGQCLANRVLIVLESIGQCIGRLFALLISVAFQFGNQPFPFPGRIRASQ